jgi:hypothetical protein
MAPSGSPVAAENPEIRLRDDAGSRLDDAQSNVEAGASATDGM